MAPAERNTRAKRRAPVACSFCRQRKMKCNNQQPSCGNCDEYGKVCTYDELPKRPRPSNSRITYLEEQNRRLQASLESLRPETRGGSAGDGADQQAISERGHSVPLERSSSAGAPRLSTNLFDRIDDLRHAETTTSPASSPPRGEDCVPPTPGPISSSRNALNSAVDGNEPHYHGPTSTLFDDIEAREARLRHQQPRNRHSPSAYWIQKGLLAEAASQRHLETINLAAGKLDFDGVDPDLGMHLLSLHWNRQHHSFLITYRPAFMRDMACGGPYFSRLLLNAIFFGASKFSNRPEVRRDPNDVRTAGWLFRERVRELLGSALDRSDITTIQALLVMTSSLFALGDERSAAWLYAGTAFRMIIDLGLHVDAAGMSNFRRLTDEDVEIRRRVFWGAFVVDKIQSLYQGRPVSLQEIEASVPLAFNDEYEELEHWQPFAYPENVAREYPGSPAYSVSCFTQLCRLSMIMNRILNKVYAERSAKKSPSELAEDLKVLHADLETWKTELPAHLVFDPTAVRSKGTGGIPPPHVLSLLAMQNVLLILLHRPFVSDGHLHGNLRALATSSFITCARAATAIVALLRAYNAAFSIRRAPYLISYATYVAATIHVRIAAQPDFASEAKEALAMCLMVFEDNQETNWAVRRARAVIGSLMKKMGVSIEPDQVAGAAEATADGRDGERVDSAHQPAGAAGVVDGQHPEPDSSNRRGNDGAFTTSDEHGHPLLTVNGVTSNGNPPAPTAAATFDIEAIISSFMSDQQPPAAAAFQSIPHPQTLSPRRSLPNQFRSAKGLEQQHPSHPYHPHALAYSSSPSSADSVPIGQPWFPPTTMPPLSSPSPYHLNQPHSPHSTLSPVGGSVMTNGTGGRFTGYGHVGPTSGATGPNDERDDSGRWRLGGDMNNVNMSASDLLFGFNSSAVEGIGWEFEGGRGF